MCSEDTECEVNKMGVVRFYRYHAHRVCHPFLLPACHPAFVDVYLR
jgi:hypothetical protein